MSSGRRAVVIKDANVYRLDDAAMMAAAGLHVP
jgi:hypothetical protein